MIIFDKALSLDNLNPILNLIKTSLPNGGIVLIKGDLAAGKTTLVKNFVAYLGIKENVTSPTFSLQHIYSNYIYHYDIYNKGSENFLEMGLLEELEKDGYHFIEWADNRLKDIILNIGLNFIKIDIKRLSNNTREYKVTVDE